jgi:hypothetical protein
MKYEMDYVITNVRRVPGLVNVDLHLTRSSVSVPSSYFNDVLVLFLPLLFLYIS